MRYIAIIGMLLVAACNTNIPTKIEIESAAGVQRRCEMASKDMLPGRITPPTSKVYACALVRLKPVEGAFYAGDIVLPADVDCVIVSTDNEFWINYERTFRCSQARSNWTAGVWNRGVRH